MNPLIRPILIALILLSVVSYSASVRAETMYVTDMLRITVREGSGPEFKIIDVIESGQEVEVIASSEQWSKIRLPDGREGWMIAKYLSPKKPGNTDFRKLQDNEALLESQNSALRRENDELKDEIKNAGLRLAEAREALFMTNKLFQTLKTNPEIYIELEKKNREAEKKLSLQKNRMENLEDELTKLVRQQNIMWLLSGAGILLVGFLIGYNAKRERRRSSLL